MNMRHSPLPWNVDDRPSNEVLRLLDTNGVEVAVVDNTFIHHRRFLATEDAAHIVRCVNAHDELVAALRDAVDFYEKRLADAKRSFVGAGDQWKDEQQPSSSEAAKRQRARAALARVEAS